VTTLTGTLDGLDIAGKHRMGSRRRLVVPLVVDRARRYEALIRFDRKASSIPTCGASLRRVEAQDLAARRTMREADAKARGLRDGGPVEAILRYEHSQWGQTCGEDRRTRREEL